MGHVRRGWGYSKNKAIAGYDEIKKDEVKQELDWSAVWLKYFGKDDQWLEIPHANKDLYNALWFRTKHGGRPHFTYTLNKDGTISPEENPEIVMGLADASSCHISQGHVYDAKGWKFTRAEEREKEEKMAENIRAITKQEVEAYCGPKFEEIFKQLAEIQNS